ncbi:MAG: hypothetical protein JXR65_00550 [Bacteroidales bacterium]|nr:hypothetical protein [Bacteroidales bacterium]
MRNKSWTSATGLMMVVLFATLMIGGLSSCKSKKKLAREKAAAEYAARVEQAKKTLTAILDGTSGWSLDEQQKQFDTIKTYNIDDPEVKDLMVKVAEKLKSEQAEAARKAEEQRLRDQEAAKRKADVEKFKPLNDAFSQIAESETYSEANQRINNTLSLFATSEVPVLIIIDQAQGFNDYDRPTTIVKFLNYLKDMKAYSFAVESVKKDAQGKITELELIKK